jgi:hypothetical protein
MVVLHTTEFSGILHVHLVVGLYLLHNAKSLCARVVVVVEVATLNKACSSSVRVLHGSDLDSSSNLKV